MDIPKKHTHHYYDYQELRNYLQTKYNYDERDYAGKYSSKDEVKDVPYLDFWHWVIKQREVNNGCYITFSREELNYLIEEKQIEDWQAEIYDHYLEFADENGELELWVYW